MPTYAAQAREMFVLQRRYARKGFSSQWGIPQIFLVRHLPFIPYTVHAHSYSCTSFLRGSLEQPQRTCKRCTMDDFYRFMLYVAWHIGHDTCPLDNFLYLSLGTPRDSPIHAHKRYSLVCGAECVATGILYSAYPLLVRYLSDKRNCTFRSTLPFSSSLHNELRFPEYLHAVSS